MARGIDMAKIGLALGSAVRDSAGPSVRLAIDEFPELATPTVRQAMKALRSATGVEDAARAARAVRSARLPQHEWIEETLTRGRVASRELGRVGGSNGRIKWAQVGRLDGSGSVRSIVKLRSEQAAHEAFAWDLAKALGVDYLFPAVGRRASGSAYIEAVAGKRLSWSSTPHEVLTSGYLKEFPGMSEEAARRAASTDVDLLNFFDYLVANSDRRAPNVLVDEARGMVRWIDNGFVGMGDLPTTVAGARQTRLRPRMQTEGLRSSWKDAPVYRMGDDALRVIRERLTPEVLRGAHARIASPIDARPIVRGQWAAHRSATTRHLLDWTTSDRYLDNVLARRAEVLRRGEFRYTPFDT